ncbi:ABC transporter substrate-binding protein [Paenibacillus hamazuiensis]|uniref:ABC transporter substrate-binding protein n=1 Tax=Paenibacillus hamazuiensis TaxID=2936508 RepID=UPI0020107887|nr:extracellular solute-binding protein [Paenibacillus hamazuiensis]
MKRTLTVLLSAALAFTAAACGNANQGSGDQGKSGAPAATEPKKETAAAPSGEPVKLRIAWWGGQARHDYTLKVIELYQQKNPNVKIETEYAAFDDYWKKLAPQAAANQLPDIIQMDVSYLSQYGGRGQLEDLEPYTKNGKLDISSVSQNTIDSGKYDGKMYQMTLGVNALGIQMDADMLKKAGADVPGNNWTWDDIDKVGAKLKANGKLVADYMRYDVFFPYYLRTMGQKLYNPDGTQLGYTDDKYFVDYYKRYQKWYDNGYFLSLDKLATKKLTPEDDEMVMGNSAFSFSWSNQYVAWAAAAKRPLELIAPPGPDGKKGLFMKSSMGFSVTKNSKVKDEAVKFINFFINDVEANKLIKGERGVPVSSKVQEALKPLLKPEEAKVFDYVAWAQNNSSPVDPPNPVGSVEIEKLLKDTSEQILYKKISVEDAAAKFRKEANAILAKNKK